MGFINEYINIFLIQLGCFASFFSLVHLRYGFCTWYAVVLCGTAFALGTLWYSAVRLLHLVRCSTLRYGFCTWYAAVLCGTLRYGFCTRYAVVLCGTAFALGTLWYSAVRLLYLVRCGTLRYGFCTWYAVVLCIRLLHLVRCGTLRYGFSTWCGTLRYGFCTWCGTLRYGFCIWYAVVLCGTAFALGTPCIHLSVLRYYKKNLGFGDIFSFCFFFY